MEIDWPALTEWQKSRPQPAEEPEFTPVKLLREGWDAVVEFATGLFQPEVVEASSGEVMPLDFSPTLILEETAESVEISYAYDALNRLTAADYDTGTYFHYAYDAVGNRLEEAKALDPLLPEVVTSSVYDSANRLTSAGGVSYTWDANGNLLSDGINNYGYDHANRLVEIVNQQSTITNQYNGLGDRLSQTVNSVTTTYTLDLNAGLTQLLQDSTNTYLYGVNRIAQVAETQTGYFLPDALGSVRNITDENGEITLTQSYTPNGEVMASVGTTQTAYAFTGESYDPQTGLVFLRARYLSYQRAL